MANAAKKIYETDRGASAGKRGRAPAAAAAAADGTPKPTGKTPIARPQPARPAFKRDQLAALLVRDEGATIAQMREATGWLPHTPDRAQEARLCHRQRQGR
ncbi:hypothetical protein BSL82_00605 [Tardibacter chloracetimidivorans]|uniref:DUF3489 domain-containing protein n=1 Tax=Tardibacter chloracetimidivorans TaxID=1921510 RepID=A0A1L3ZQT2_9SPHN|nr:DUF3489 domain-containing protein [Tardibacter chloracetimidivorans]API57986.1 hypothetical protein BSL82_00605 [Tardibacter chloracetimidivorans]